MKLGSKDTIPPEAIVDALIFPRDGATIAVWKDGYASCLWQVIGIARLLQVLSAGQADIVTSQLQLWREAKEGSRELAQEQPTRQPWRWHSISSRGSPGRGLFYRPQDWADYVRQQNVARVPEKRDSRVVEPKSRISHQIHPHRV